MPERNDDLLGIFSDNTPEPGSAMERGALMVLKSAYAIGVELSLEPDIRDDLLAEFKARGIPTEVTLGLNQQGEIVVGLHWRSRDIGTAAAAAMRARGHTVGDA